MILLLWRNSKLGSTNRPWGCVCCLKTAVPFWGQTNQNSSSLSPKRDCGSKRVCCLTCQARRRHYTAAVRYTARYFPSQLKTRLCKLGVMRARHGVLGRGRFVRRGSQSLTACGHNESRLTYTAVLYNELNAHCYWRVPGRREGRREIGQRPLPPTCTAHTKTATYRIVYHVVCITPKATPLPPTLELVCT